MRLLFLGTGTGLSANLDNFQSNMLLVTDGGKKLLIDCGTDIRFSLAQQEFNATDIDAVYASHTHADHIGGLEWFALQRKFVFQTEAPGLIAHEKLLPHLWEHSLSGGLKTLDDKEATLADFFNVHNLIDDAFLKWEDIEIQSVQTIHVHSNHTVMPSYGLVIKNNNKTFFITTDTQFTPDVFASHYNHASLIFHDCETLKNPSTVHAHYQQLKSLPPAIKRKMWLYHYNDGVLPDAVNDGFLGFAKLGQWVDL